MKVYISTSNPFHLTSRSFVAFGLGLILSIIIRILLMAFPLQAHAFGQESPQQPVISPLALMEEKITASPTPGDQSFSLISNPISISDIQATAYVLINLDSREILAQRGMHKKLPVASLTKLMTAAVALDLAQPEEVFAVSENAAKQIPTKIGVKAGTALSLEELLNALLLTSANDAAEIIREGIDSRYGGPVFLKAMNRKARLLGLINTHFDNPQGFDSPDNYSSAYDLALLTNVIARDYPYIMNLVGKERVTIPKTMSHARFDLLNWNGLIGIYPDVLGMKIGNTENAGKTTIVLSRRNNIRLLAVVLGTHTVLSRDMVAAKLLNEGYARISGALPIEVTETMLQNKYNSWSS